MNIRILRYLLVMLAMILSACTSADDPSVGALAETARPSLPTASVSDMPSATPIASSTSIPVDAAAFEPIAGSNLPLAGRDGAAGPVRCGGVGPTTLEDLVAGSVGAELLEGPEYDVLRATIARYGDDPEFATMKSATFREFRLDDTSVVFLGDIGNPEGPFASVTAAFDGMRWAWAGMDGACVVTGEPGPGWGGVNWTLDPAFRAPTAKTRTLHLLATEAECTKQAPLDGRLAPAYVFIEPDRVRVQLSAKTIEVGAPCEGIEPTAVTVRLPEPIGDRVVKDAHPEPCRGCGG